MKNDDNENPRLTKLMRAVVAEPDDRAWRLAVARLAAAGAGALAARLLPEVAQGAGRLFAFTPALLALGLAVALGGAVLGALAPAAAAARVDPARGLG